MTNKQNVFHNTTHFVCMYVCCCVWDWLFFVLKLVFNTRTVNGLWPASRASKARALAAELTHSPLACLLRLLLVCLFVCLFVQSFVVVRSFVYRRRSLARSLRSLLCRRRRRRRSFVCLPAACDTDRLCVVAWVYDARVRLPGDKGKFLPLAACVCVCVCDCSAKAI